MNIRMRLTMYLMNRDEFCSTLGVYPLIDHPLTIARSCSQMIEPMNADAFLVVSKVCADIHVDVYVYASMCRCTCFMCICICVHTHRARTRAHTHITHTSHITHITHITHAHTRAHTYMNTQTRARARARGHPDWRCGRLSWH